jgi:hypothetical protein
MIRPMHFSIMAHDHTPCFGLDCGGSGAANLGKKSSLVGWCEVLRIANQIGANAYGSAGRRQIKFRQRS